MFNVVMVHCRISYTACCCLVLLRDQRIFSLLTTGDNNKARRDAVRRKTGQYLIKAEDLYNRHLAKESLDQKRWAVRFLVITVYSQGDLNSVQSPLCGFVIRGILRNVNCSKLLQTKVLTGFKSRHCIKEFGCYVCSGMNGCFQL